ncbi:protein reticulata-related 5, chloroplastic [Tanacetum coccineum]
MRVEESLNVTFDETPPPLKTLPLEDNDLVKEEVIEMINYTVPGGVPIFSIISMQEQILTFASKAVTNGGANGILLVVNGASHVAYGSRGTGVPARIARKMQKKKQTVILLDPERQYIRRESEVLADFLWYSAARPCTRNYFDHAEIARVMNAAGRRQDALLQKTLAGKDWNVGHRVASVVVGCIKLAGVGFISSIEVVAASNVLYSLRNFLNPTLVNNQQNKRSPILKTVVIYSGFLGTSANLRYQLMNPITTDVVCTTTIEALVVGKIVICANHISNEFFKRTSPNTLSFIVYAILFLIKLSNKSRDYRYWDSQNIIYSANSTFAGTQLCTTYKVTYAQVVISFLEICYWTLEVITTSKIRARGHHPYYGINYPGSIAT